MSATIALLFTLLVGSAWAEDPSDEPEAHDVAVDDTANPDDDAAKPKPGKKKGAGFAVVDPDDPPEELPVAGYEKNGLNGFFIQSPNGLFRLNIGGFTQLRYNLTWSRRLINDPLQLTHGFSVPRTRFFFEGHFTKWFDYHLRLNIDGEGQFTLLVATGQLNFAPGWYLRAGVQYFPLSREDWMYAQDVLGIEYSPNDFTLAIGSSAGALFHYSGKVGRVWFGVSNGAYGGKETFPAKDAADVAFTTRAEFLLASSDWSPFDSLIGRPGEPFGVLLGVAGGYQYAGREDTARPRHGWQAIADVSIGGDGFQFMAAGTFQAVVRKDNATDLTGGLMVGGGGFPIRWLHLFARYDLIHPHIENPSLKPFNQVAVGLSAFPFEWTNRIKFTIEGSYHFEAINQTLVAPSGALGLVSADGPGQISLRTQAQVGF